MLANEDIGGMDGDEQKESGKKRDEEGGV